MPGEADLGAAPGFIAPELKAEFPGLRLDWVTARASPQPSPRELKRHLRDLSGRYRGANVVAMRTQPIPHAYRRCRNIALAEKNLDQMSARIQIA